MRRLLLFALFLLIVSFGARADTNTSNVASRWGAQKLAAHPLISLYYSDTPDIWKADTWREVPADDPKIVPDRNGVKFTAERFGGLSIECIAVGKFIGNELRWTIELHNQSRGVVVGVIGPILRDIPDVPTGALYIPDRPGQKLDNPWTTLTGERKSINYPVPASMQYLAYAGSNGGTAYHVFDREKVLKQFRFGGPYRELSVCQYPFVPPAGAWKSPLIVWQSIDKDWHEAADRYRSWFRTVAPKPTLSERVKSYPIIGGTVVLSRPVDDANLHDVMKRQEVGNYAAALEQARGLKQAGFQGTQLVGWFGQGHDTTYPDHLPSDLMGGRSGLIEALKGMKDIGMIPGLYLNARLANVTSPTFLAHPDWEVRMGNGQRWTEGYGNQKFALMCPGSAEWRAHLKHEALRCVGEYGAEFVQLDQIGAASSVLCFNPNHGHRTPATAWGEGYPALLKEIQTEARKLNPLFWDWVEGAWEGAGPYIDLSQGGYWESIVGTVTFPEMVRYTLPDQPLFGDARMGGTPFWCPTDIHRAARIDTVAGKLMREATFMDNIGLSSDPQTEVHWFRGKTQVVLTGANLSKTDHTVTITMDLKALRRSRLPKRAHSAATGVAAMVVLNGASLLVSAPIPAGQVDAFVLDW